MIDALQTDRRGLQEAGHPRGPPLRHAGLCGARDRMGFRHGHRVGGDARLLAAAAQASVARFRELTEAKAVPAASRAREATDAARAGRRQAAPERDRASRCSARRHLRLRRGGLRAKLRAPDRQGRRPRHPHPAARRPRPSPAPTGCGSSPATASATTRSTCLRSIERGIALAVVGDVNSVSVAEQAMMLLLAAAKRLVRGDRSVREDDWEWRNRLEASELAGKRLLIIGYRPDRPPARAHGSGVRHGDARASIRSSQRRGWPEGPVAAGGDLKAGLAWADAVSVNVPKADRPMIGSRGTRGDEADGDPDQHRTRRRGGRGSAGGGAAETGVSRRRHRRLRRRAARARQSALSHRSGGL